MKWMFVAGSLLIATGSIVASQSASSGTRVRLGIIYPGGESTGPVEIRRAVEPLGPELTIFAPGSGGNSLGLDTDLGEFDLLLVDGSTTGLEQHAAQLAAATRRTRVVVVEPTTSLSGNVALDRHPWIREYWNNPSQDNYAALARYVVERVLGRTPLRGSLQPPIVYPSQGFYHPDAPALFKSIDDYLHWYRARPTARGRHAYDPAKLTLGLYCHLISYQQKNREHIDALVRATERRGQNVVALAFRSNPVLGAFAVRGQPAIDVLIFAGSLLHLRDRDAALADAKRLGIPILGAMNHSSMDASDYARSLTGLHPSLTSVVVDAEQEGRIEPIVISGKGAPNGDRNFIAPFPAQVEWRIDRALAWARLHRVANAAKRVVFTSWSEGGGKANLGGDPDDFLDVQATLVRMLHEMRARGYDVGSAPLPDRDTLSERMALTASNVGTWAPGEIAARVRRGEVALLPEETYKRWYAALPAIRRAEIEEMWGPPPGKVMVYADASGHRSLVMPGLTFGNVLIAPNPDWGYLQDNKVLMSVGHLPPHHQYLAFFLWLRHHWRADAWVSLFTNISLQPGKAEGPAADEHIAILLGSLPHIHPERLGASGPGNKRKTMAQTTSWYNIVGASDESEKFFELRARLARYAEQTDEGLRREAEPLIRAEVVHSGLDRALERDVAAMPFTELLNRVRSHLDKIERALSPHGTKVLGDAPIGHELVGMVTAMLGSDLRAALQPLSSGPVAAARLVSAVVIDKRAPRDVLLEQLSRSSVEAEKQLGMAADYAARLRTAPRETMAILDSLEGRWIEPGPMDEPVRKPDSLPPGRSLYNFDQAAIPTPEAEAIGVKQAEAMIATHREKHGGAYPSTLAFIIWSSEISKNNGVTEAQMLHLLGTRAVRNARGEVTGVELISREELSRPRVDVLATTSGTYRDHYQDKVELIAQATRLAAASPEPDNPVAAATLMTEARLRAGGETAERAAALARARVFSPAAGAYSPNIQFLAKSGDQRGDEARMAELYTSRLSHAYGAGLYGESARAAFEQNLLRVNSATLPRSSNVNGLLDEPMPAGFLGGLNLAARAVTGKDVDLYVSDLRDPKHVSIEPAAQALQTELRTRYLNASWLKAMQAHGYDGARTMMFLTDNLDLWDSTATSTVGSKDWADVKSVYIDDTLGLDMDRFFDRYNPHAQQVLLGNLLGAASHGQWQASAADLAKVAGRLAQSAADHGAACEANICRNPALTKYVESSLASVPGGAELAARYRAALDRATTVNPADLVPVPTTAAAPLSNTSIVPPAAAAGTPAAPSAISGRVLEDSVTASAMASGPVSSQRWWVLGVLAVALFGIGFARPPRA